MGFIFHHNQEVIAMLTPVSSLSCPVMADLSRHLAALDQIEAQEESIAALAADRYRFLTESAEGFAQVMESVYDHYPDLDQALFGLFGAWLTRTVAPVHLTALCGLLELEADQLARRWAEEEYDREMERAENARADDRDLDWAA